MRAYPFIKGGFVNTLKHYKMRTLSIIKTSLKVICLAILIHSCGNKQHNTAETQTVSVRTDDELGEQYRLERTQLVTEAEQIIAEYNLKAEDIKYSAIRNNKNLDNDVKMKLIEMETKVEKLENKLENVKFQTDESWGRFKEELHHDIDNIREGIKDLSGKNSVG